MSQVLEAIFESGPLAPSVRAYVQDVERRASERGVAWDLKPLATVPYNGQSAFQVSGYFVIHPDPVLAVATGKLAAEWLAVLAHEACHMDQWWENAPAWQDNFLPDGREAVDRLDAWCSFAEELSPEDLLDTVRRAKRVEFDCERRTLVEIARHGLPINAAIYAQRANAYVHFYDHVARTRAWHAPGDAPYQREDVWRCAPARLVETCPAALTAAYEAHYPVPDRPLRKALSPR